MPSIKSRAFWPALLVLLLADCASKRAAETYLGPYPRPVLGEVVQLHLAYNRGAATGWSFGNYSRPILSVLAALAVIALVRLYRAAPARDWRLGAATALVIAGAIGNLLDRLRSPLGVVDFIDVGVGSLRFWTFNVADVGVTLGAAALALILWRRDGSLAPRAPDGAA